MRLLGIFLVSVFFASAAQADRPQVPHLEMELDSSTYQSLLASRNGGARSDKVQASLDMGKRFLAWLAFINDKRPQGKKISLTSPATTVAYPIDKPNKSNPDLINARYEELKSAVPAWMQEIAFGNGEFISDLPESDEVFIKYGFSLDRNYQSAARWTLQEPMLWAYSGRKSGDVRGYYQLNKISDLEAKFQGWSSLSVGEKSAILTAMNQLCWISQTESRCKSTLLAAKEDGEKLSTLHAEWMPAGKKKWDSYFEMSGLRSDVKWSAANLMQLPFKTPQSAAIKSFLVDNIEDEWKWAGWSLKLDFDSSAAAYVRFEPGATPNVNGLGGNRITMDANAPLTEYGVQWTIRHEFGHVLGFPDCYVEFYDSDEKAMINYQLDTTNLMCSRRGKLQEKHLVALKAAYFEN